MPQPEEKENEIWVRVKEPDLFQDGSFKRIPLDAGKGIFAIVGKLKGENKTTIQALRFQKEKGWTIDKAVAWKNEHKFETNKFYNDTDELDLDELYKQGEAYKYEEAKTYDINDKEIFKTGTWTDREGVTKTYTVKDIDEVIKAFDAGVGAKDGIPLRIGSHDKIYDMAGGWIKSLKRVGNSLVASFKNIPKLIKEFIENKAYKNLSCGFIRNVLDPTTKNKYSLVLNHVALLGAKLPAVKGLDDWGKFYDVAEEVIEFSEEGGELEQINKDEEVRKMELEEKVKQLEAEKVTMSAELEKSKAEVEKQKTELTAKEEQISKFNEERQRKELRIYLEQQVKDGRIFPVQVPFLMTILESSDAEKKIKFSADGKAENIKEMTPLEIVKAYVEHLPKLGHLVEVSAAGDITPKKEFTTDEDGTKENKQLNALAEEKAKEKKISFTEALREVSVEHPELVITPGKE